MRFLHVAMRMSSPKCRHEGDVVDLHRSEGLSSQSVIAASLYQTRMHARLWMAFRTLSRCLPVR